MATDPHPGLLNPSKIKVDRSADVPRAPSSIYPEVLMHGMELLNQQLIRKNTFYASEFKRFIPLFKNEERTIAELSNLQMLSNEYFSRISRQHPVYVITDQGWTEQPNDHYRYMRYDKYYHRILLRLPPIYLPMKTINELVKTKGSQFTAFLYRALTSSNRYDKNVPVALGVLKSFCKELGDDSVAEKYASMYARFDRDREELRKENGIESSESVSEDQSGEFDIDKAFKWE